MAADRPDFIPIIIIIIILLMVDLYIVPLWFTLQCGRRRRSRSISDCWVVPMISRTIGHAHLTDTAHATHLSVESAQTIKYRMSNRSYLYKSLKRWSNSYCDTQATITIFGSGSRIATHLVLALVHAYFSYKKLSEQIYAGWQIKSRNFGHMHASFLCRTELHSIRCKKLVPDKSVQENWTKHDTRSNDLHKSTCTYKSFTWNITEHVPPILDKILIRLLFTASQYVRHFELWTAPAQGFHF